MATLDSKAIATTLETISRNKPVYAELVNTFSPLLAKQAELAEKFSAEELTLPMVDPARLSQGVHILAGNSCEDWKASLQTASRAIVPILTALIQDENWPGKAEDITQLNEELLVKLAEARLSGDETVFENASENMNGTPPTVLLFVIDSVLAPVLASVADRLGESISKVAWSRGNCPVCGSLPSIAYLSPREPGLQEELVGGGGKKYLHCSLCGHDWKHRRDTCPACGNTDQDKREVLFADDAKHERIEICHECNTYCLCVDFRECDPLPQLDAIQLGLVHLDVIAQEKEYSPMSLTAWNNLQS